MPKPKYLRVAHIGPKGLIIISGISPKKNTLSRDSVVVQFTLAEAEVLRDLLIVEFKKELPDGNHVFHGKGPAHPGTGRTGRQRGRARTPSA
jgi:hypothetical protein